MGLLVDGQWKDQWYDTKSIGGRFERQDARFRHQVRADGSSAFAPEAGRYHLYVAMACPWAHRALLFRTLKGLSGAIGLSVVHPDMLGNGWEFSANRPDHLFGSDYLHQVYTRAVPDYSGRVTVPLLWDKHGATIVNNESSEIIRLFNSEFSAVANPDAPMAGFDLYPDALRADIDAINELVYDTVNNGVYKAGFATTQHAYDDAVIALFETLDLLDERLGGQRFLVGDRLTEADWRLFTTLLRFDPVYYSHFKCNLHRLRDYANLYDHTRALFQVPGVGRTVDIAATRRHYYFSHDSINPHRVVPIGPHVDYHLPHTRGDWREWVR